MDYSYDLTDEELCTKIFLYSVLIVRSDNLHFWVAEYESNNHGI
jgi:hypothetical protein